MAWDQLGLLTASLDAVRRFGYDTPTEVQQKAIPRVHAGVDLIVQAKTGSGKTLAFGLPILECLDAGNASVQALVLTPTRELAMQVSEEITRAGVPGNRALVPIFGGASMTAQIRRLEEGAQVAVGTPGRILDHLSRKTLSLTGARMVVLDEADEMLDRGFLPDVMKILDHTPGTKQTMLFSATIPLAVKEMAERYLKEPETIMIGKAGLSINYDIRHSYYRVQRFHKFVVLVNLLHTLPRTKVLIFCNQKSGTESVAEYLHNEGFAVGFWDGDLSQRVRIKTLEMFKSGIIDILVATDVASRGIDIFGVSHVINYDVPENKERYVHRTGRTGRAGHTGEAISLATPADLLAIGTIERNMEVKFHEREVPGKDEVKAGIKGTFIERLRAMEKEGYPDDLSLFADVILGEVEAYTAVAGLMVFLRQRGWDFEHGYDPDKPEHREQFFIRPVLLGKRSDSAAHPRSDDARRPRGRDSAGRKDRIPAAESSRGNSRPGEWLVLSLGSKDGMSSPRDILSLVCQTAGIKKAAIGTIKIGERETRFQIRGEAADRIIDAFSKSMKSPGARVRREGRGH